MTGDNLSDEARLAAVEIVVRHIFSLRGPIERDNLRTLIGVDATRAEVAALRSGDPERRVLAAEVRAPLERLVG